MAALGRHISQWTESLKWISNNTNLQSGLSTLAFGEAEKLHHIHCILCLVLEGKGILIHIILNRLKAKHEFQSCYNAIGIRKFRENMKKPIVS